MRLKQLSLATLITVGAVSLSSLAFAGGGMHMGRMGGDMHRFMHQMMDSNKDGSVDEKEFQAFRDQHFTKLDQNHDGKLSAKEFAMMPKIMAEMRKKAKEMAQQERLKKHFAKLDANGDGKISKAEFDAKGERSFIRMDQNDDGLLNKKDRMKMMHKMKKMHEMNDRH